MNNGRRNMLRKKDIEDLRLITIEKESTIDYSFMFYLRSQLCCVSKSDKFVEYYEFMGNYIQDRLEIVKYFKTIDVLDKLRWLLLNYHQNMSLEYMKLPNLANEKEYELLIKPEEKGKITCELIDYFGRKIRGKTMDDKDEKLFNLLDHEMRSLFDLVET